MLELDNVSKFFDAISSDEELSRRIETALANYPGSLEMREFLVEDILFPIAEELGLDVSSVSRTLKRARRNLYTFLRYGGRSLLCELEN